MEFKVWFKAFLARWKVKEHFVFRKYEVSRSHMPRKRYETRTDLSFASSACEKWTVVYWNEGLTYDNSRPRLMNFTLQTWCPLGETRACLHTGQFRENTSGFMHKLALFVCLLFPFKRQGTKYTLRCLPRLLWALAGQPPYGPLANDIASDLFRKYF